MDEVAELVELARDIDPDEAYDLLVAAALRVRPDADLS